MTGNDTIIGGAATTVYSAQQFQDIAHERVVGGATVISFNDNQVLEVKGALINFKGGDSQMS